MQLLWHCFGGDADMARRIIRNGWHISIPGPVSYPANKAVREALAVIPDDRLLLETDQPIESIARQIGVENTKYFFVLFKKFKGMTPRQFRCKAETPPL